MPQDIWLRNKLNHRKSGALSNDTNSYRILEPCYPQIYCWHVCDMCWMDGYLAGTLTHTHTRKYRARKPYDSPFFYFGFSCPVNQRYWFRLFLAIFSLFHRLYFSLYIARTNKLRLPTLKYPYEIAFVQRLLRRSDTAKNQSVDQHSNVHGRSRYSFRLSWFAWHGPKTKTKLDVLVNDSMKSNCSNYNSGQSVNGALV